MPDRTPLIRWIIYCAGLALPLIWLAGSLQAEPSEADEAASIDWGSYAAEDLWAFQPLTRPTIPESPRGSVQHPVDAFTAARLAERGLVPAPRADATTLLRRASFDLRGLAPQPDEIARLEADPRPDAFQRVLDHLLASPHYGERWARHWLDVVRYADTSGFSNDYERPNAWRYRDYVVRSFNSDKPYDRFVVEQLAGDELYDAGQQDPELLIASGFLRMGPWEHTGMSVKAVTRQQYLDDVTNSVGVTFLAMGLRCARCHDHKFDPIPTHDYYSMQAVFAPLQLAERKAEFLDVENTYEFDAGRQRAEQQLKEAEDFLQEIRQKQKAAVAEFLQQRGVDDVKQLPSEERPKRHYGLTPVEMGLQKIYQKRRDYFQREANRYEPFAFSTYSGPDNDYRSNTAINHIATGDAKPDDVFVLMGGSLSSPGQKVEPAVLTAVHRYGGDQVPSPPEIDQPVRGRRLALARWIVDPRNPLTARVMANRVWQYHFGKGIAENANNFGKMGKKPTHPELLDYLACELIDSGWSIKHLHRLIMTSQTYQRSASHPDIRQVRQVDPNNELLSYFPPRRLTAEELRDAMLQVSGELNTAMGGPSIFPDINWEVALQPRHIMGSVAPAYQPSPQAEDRHRRTLYAFTIRTLPDPMLEVFNRPSSEVSCERRDETTVTPQVFSLLNSHWVHQRAIAMALRLERSSDTAAEQVNLGFQWVAGRLPTEQERQRCLAHLEQMTIYHKRHEPQAYSLPREVTRQMIEELTGEAYAWTEQLDLMEHYQRDTMPWQVSPQTRALADLCLVLLNSNEFVYVY